jgi:hypothetical protein
LSQGLISLFERFLRLCRLAVPFDMSCGPRVDIQPRTLNFHRFQGLIKRYHMLGSLVAIKAVPCVRSSTSFSQFLAPPSKIPYCYGKQRSIANPNTRRTQNEHQRSWKTMAGVPQVQFTKKIRSSRMSRFSPDLARILEKGTSKPSPQTTSLNS